MQENQIAELKKSIRDIRDFPKKGIVFKDITTLLKNGDFFATAVDYMYDHFREQEVDLVASIEARGYILGAAMAYKLNSGFIPIRKPGKLPAKKISEEYDLEYGKDKLEIHKDALKSKQRVLLIDDLLATGGTAIAACKLIEKLKAQVVGIAFLIELNFLNGRQLLDGYDIFSLISYDSE